MCAKAVDERPDLVGDHRPSVAEVEAAARVLDRERRSHGWSGPTARSYDDLDLIGKDEFSALVERMLMATAQARAALPPIVGS